jgi:hypothetical protein
MNRLQKELNYYVNREKIFILNVKFHNHIIYLNVGDDTNGHFRVKGGLTPYSRLVLAIRKNQKEVK